MRLRFLGAAQSVTGSMHLVHANGTNIILDCGLRQGKRKETFELNRNFRVDPRSVHALVLSHAHIDHSGNIPTLVRKGFAGRIYATEATADLCRVLLRDSASLQERDVEYVNKKRRNLGKTPFEPLYTVRDAEAVNGHFSPVRYEQLFEPAPGVRCAFFDAGHILGAGITRLEIREGSRMLRLLYSGDLGRNNMPILRDPVIVRNCDALITESTYGNRLHPAEENVKAKLAELIRDVVRSKGRLVIPAFSVGRTQAVLYYIDELLNNGLIPQIPIFVDSPLSRAATRVFAGHQECYDPQMLELIRQGKDPFAVPGLEFVESVEDSKALNEREPPFIIISASGMCEGGRILHHLSHTIEDPRSIILIVGYQSENTLGWRLVKRTGPYRIFGDEYQLRARIEVLNALSAHADRNEMLGYYRLADGHIRTAFVVHGELDQAEPFAQALRDSGVRDVLVPHEGQTVEL